MRRALILLATLSVAVLAAPAGAQQAPSFTIPGVTATQGTGGRVTIRFADTPAGRAAYARYAGRLVTIRCQHVDDAPLGSGPVGVVTTRVRMARTLSSVRLRLRGDKNLCSLGSGGVVVPADATSRRFLADVGAGGIVLTTAEQIHTIGSAATLRRLKGGVRLSSRTASPPRGRVGIFGDRGGPRGAVTVTRDGHRLFVEQTGDTVRTNVLGPLDQLQPFAPPRGVDLPVGPQPPAGTPLPARSDPDVTATREGTLVSVDFKGAARRAVTGARVDVECTLNRPAIGLTLPETTGASGRGPRPGRALRLRVARRFHLCVVSFATHTVRIALDQSGRVALEEASVAAGLDRVLHNAGAGATTGYPTAAALSARYRTAVAPLAAPTEAPPDRRVAAWSDGQKHLILSAVARTGRRLFIDVDGPVVTTNTLGLALPDV